MAHEQRVATMFSKAGLGTALVVAVLAVSSAWATPQRDQYPWEQMQQHSFDVADGGTLSVRVDDADLAVTASTNGAAEVSIRLRSNDMEWARDRFERTNYRARQDGDTVVIESDKEPDNSWRSGNWMSVHVEVRLPSRFDLDLVTQDGDVSVAAFEGKARVHSQDGDLTIDSLQGGDIELRTQDGDVRATLLSGPTIEVFSQDGDIDVGALGGSVTVHTQDGDIRIGSADTRQMELESSDGDIHVALVTSDARMSLETRDGDISIEAPSSLQANIDFAGEDVSIRGGFRINGSVSRGRAEGNVNGGGGEIRAHTRDGSVRLIEREAR